MDNNGNISVPYAGNIRAKGRTPVQVQQAIVDALKNRAIEPQAVVSLATQRTSLVTVLGDVARPQVLTAVPAGERILDSIARAGGQPRKATTAWSCLSGVVVVQRPPLAHLSINLPIISMRTPAIRFMFTVSHRHFWLLALSAFSAVLGGRGKYPSRHGGISLAEAMAKAGGVNDVQGDPAAIFLYRGELRGSGRAARN